MHQHHHEWNEKVTIPQKRFEIKLSKFQKWQTFSSQEVQDYFSKLLSNEAWKEVYHFLHWAVISSHPDNRNATDPFSICLMLFIVQEWENLKNAKHEKSREKNLKFKIWNKIIKVSKMTDNFQFLNRQEIFYFSLEQRAKCNAQGAEKNQHPCTMFVRRYKTLSASYSVIRLGKKFVNSCIGQWYPHTLTTEIQDLK